MISGYKFPHMVNMIFFDGHVIDTFGGAELLARGYCYNIVA
jgi:prepilin-type processing-associated H-X9-DG protein